MTRIPLFVVSIALANFLVPLNSTMIVVALPAIGRDLGVDRATAAWLVTSYLIAMAALQPIGGRIGDRFGRRRLLLAALVVFGILSAAAPFAPTFAALAGFRLAIALCAAVISPNSMGLLRGGAVEGRAGTYFGVAGAFGGVGASIGPVLGGLLATFDWRLIFAVNVPLVLAILALGWYQLPHDVPRRASPLDAVGAVSVGVLLTVAAWALTRPDAISDPVTFVLLAAVALGGVLLFRYESRLSDPALPPALFRIRAFSTANVTIGLSNLTLYGSFIAIPIALAGLPDASVTTGVVLTSQALAVIVLSPVSGALVDRFGARLPTALGGACLAVGLALPVALHGTADPAVLLIGMPIMGAGLAFNFPATRIAALDAAPARLASLASGVTQTSRYFGGIVGSLAAAAALVSDTSALPTLFLAFAGAGVASALVGVTLPAHITMGEEIEPEVSIAD
jgi:MFS family permease